MNYSDPELAGDLHENIFRSFIENGTIRVEGRPIGDIIIEYRETIAEMIASGIGLELSIDHRDSLLLAAERESGEENLELAVTFYALWIEHAVNGYLIDGLGRKGYKKDVSIPLIRELRIQAKLTALWNMASFPPIAKEDLKLIEEVSQARNAFVHYKWPSSDGLEDETVYRRLKDIVIRAETLVDIFDRSATTTLRVIRNSRMRAFADLHLIVI